MMWFNQADVLTQNKFWPLARFDSFVLIQRLSVVSESLMVAAALVQVFLLSLGVETETVIPECWFLSAEGSSVTKPSHDPIDRQMWTK